MRWSNRNQMWRIKLGQHCSSNLLRLAAATLNKSGSRHFSLEDIWQEVKVPEQIGPIERSHIVLIQPEKWQTKEKRITWKPFFLDTRMSGAPQVRSSMQLWSLKSESDSRILIPNRKIILLSLNFSHIKFRSFCNTLNILCLAHFWKACQTGPGWPCPLVHKDP